MTIMTTMATMTTKPTGIGLKVSFNKSRSNSAKKNNGNNKDPFRDNSDELTVINRVEKSTNRRRTGSPVGNLLQEKIKVQPHNDNRNNKSDNRSDKPNLQKKSRGDVGNNVCLGVLNLPDPARLAVRLESAVRRLG
jgi:hypothetical protein